MITLQEAAQNLSGAVSATENPSQDISVSPVYYDDFIWCCLIVEVNIRLALPMMSTL